MYMYLEYIPNACQAGSAPFVRNFISGGRLFILLFLFLQSTQGSLAVGCMITLEVTP